MTRYVISMGWGILLSVNGSATFGQSPLPSPSGPPVSATTAFDGHYSGDSKAVADCRPGSFDITVKTGALAGTFGFPSVSDRNPHDFTWTASGTVEADGTVTAVFKTDDRMVSNAAHVIKLTGTVEGERLDLTQVGGTCHYTASLRKTK